MIASKQTWLYQAMLGEPIDSTFARGQIALIKQALAYAKRHQFREGRIHHFEEAVAKTREMIKARLHGRQEELPL